MKITIWVSLIFLLPLSYVPKSSSVQADLPHVDNCSICKDCTVSAKSTKKIDSSMLTPELFQPSYVHSKQKKPVCEKCTGCTTTLQILVQGEPKPLFGTNFYDEIGSSPNWLFVAPTDKTKNGMAIVKIACIPVSKHELKIARCHAQLAVNHAKILLGLDEVAVECGLDEVVPRVWVEHVSAVIPGIGYHINWLAMWSEIAPGVSLENLIRLGKPMMHPNNLLDILHNRLNKTKVVFAAMFDLLTSQCDRHAQNIFIDEDGGITLIDNERALFENGHCAIDSILLPGTKKFAINVLENAWVHKFKNWGSKVPQFWANPPLLLDYRCYVVESIMAQTYPPKMHACLVNISGMEAQDVHKKYGFPTLTEAVALLNRSRAMINYGFEAALVYGYPLNPPAWRYHLPPPCCHIVHTDTYRCSHAWTPNTSLPKGDPMSGGPWRHDWKDPGTYELEVVS